MYADCPRPRHCPTRIKPNRPARQANKNSPDLSIPRLRRPTRTDRVCYGSGREGFGFVWEMPIKANKTGLDGSSENGHDDGFEHFGFGSAGSQTRKIDEQGRFRWLMLKGRRSVTH